MNKKGIVMLSVTAAAIITGSIISAVTIGYIPIAGKFIAQNKIKNYIHDQYEQEADVTCSYSFHDSNYTVESSLGNSMKYILQKDVIYDEKVSDTIDTKSQII